MNNAFEIAFPEKSAYEIFRKKQKTYEKTKEVFGNPLMGYAPCAWNESVGGCDASVYGYYLGGT